MVERLLTANADVDTPACRCDGVTALQAAAEDGHIDVIERLLAANAAVNAPVCRTSGITAMEAEARHGPFGIHGDHSDMTALQAAKKGAHIDMMKILKKPGRKNKEKFHGERKKVIRVERMNFRQ